MTEAADVPAFITPTIDAGVAMFVGATLFQALIEQRDTDPVVADLVQHLRNLPPVAATMKDAAVRMADMLAPIVEEAQHPYSNERKERI